METRSDNLRINQLSEKGFRWYLEYLNTIDNRDIEAYAGYLSDEFTLQINNNPSVNGKERITKTPYFTESI
jgi:predicted transcriptional regulator of viral defense system